MTNFRSPELVKRYEYSYYDLQTPLDSNVGNNQRQTKDNYLFVVDNTSEANPIDWYNAYFEVDFKLVKYADGGGITAGANNGDQDGTTTNGHTLIAEIQVECNGITVYNNTVANETSNVLQLLNYTKSYADSVGKDQFFYTDTSTGTTEGRSAQAVYNEGFAKRKTLTDARAINKISIPLTIIDRANFEKFFGILNFDLRNQDEDVKNSVVSVTFRYQLNDDAGSNCTINVLVLHEK